MAPCTNQSPLCQTEEIKTVKLPLTPVSTKSRKSVCVCMSMSTQKVSGRQDSKGPPGLHSLVPGTWPLCRGHRWEMKHTAAMHLYWEQTPEAPTHESAHH